MPPTRFWIGSTFVLAAACGGVDATPIAPPASEDGATPEPDASAVDATLPPDDAALPPKDGGLPPKDAAPPPPDASPPPNQIPCGNQKCMLPGQVCCETSSLTLDGGLFTVTRQCTAGNACAGSAIRCLSAANCGKNEVCCFGSTSISINALPSSSCKANKCGITEVQACASQGECLSGACAPHKCNGGDTVNLCSGIPGNCP